MSFMSFSMPGNLAPSKHYEWQILADGQWLKIDNDSVIEAHYTQPGTKEMCICTKNGPVRIDFDLIQTQSISSCDHHSVQRVCCLPPGQVEVVGWYFKDDHLWQEYGCTVNGIFSSVYSKDIEVLYCQNPKACIQFTIGSTAYTLDFTSMNQTNSTTGKNRKVRRRPKFLINPEGLDGPRWQFLDYDGVWKDYSKDYNQCSLASPDIEFRYRQRVPKIRFTTRSFHYELNFTSMDQKNMSTNTKRCIRRLEQ